jgi:hypothetical protein
MMSCPREAEVKQLLERGQWPQATSPDLRDHVSGCRTCRELVLVTEIFQNARSVTMAAARPASPGVLWWRAQLRRRNAAVARIGKPLLGAQIFALAVSLACAVGFLVWQAQSGIAWLTWFQQLPQPASFHFDAQWFSSLWSSDPANSGLYPMLLISAFAVLAVVGGVVVYLTSEKH